MVECDIFGNIKKSKKNNGVKIKVETNEYQDEEQNKTKACWTIVTLLSDHINVHNGEKTYKCKLCSSCFASLGQHAKHERRHFKSGVK